MLRLRSIREGLSILRGNILIMTLVGVLGQFGRSMAFPYASLYILSLGGEPAHIGWINSLAPLAGLVAFPIAGYLADSVGRVRIIGLAGLLSGAIYSLYVFAPNWRLIAVAAFLQGFMVVQFPASSALMADSLSPEDRARGVAAMHAIPSAVAMVAPYVAGAVLAAAGVDAGMRLLYGYIMVVYGITALISLRYLKETATHAPSGSRPANLPSALRGAYGDIPALLRQLSPSLRALAGVLVVGFVANAISGPFWVVYAVERLRLSSEQWGLILLLESAVRTAAFVPAGAIADRCGRVRVMVASLLLTLVSAPFFVFVSGFAAVLTIRCVVGVANALFIPAAVALLADLVPRDMRGRIMAAMGQGTVMIGMASGGSGGPGLGFLVHPGLNKTIVKPSAACLGRST